MTTQLNIKPAIRSITLEPKKEGAAAATDIYSVRSFLYISNTARIENYNVRLALAKDKSSAKVLDFLTQRLNEYIALSAESKDFSKKINTFQYNQILSSIMAETQQYLQVSSPFSPFSTDLAAKDALLTNSNSAHGPSLPPGITVFDIPLSQIVEKNGDGTLAFQEPEGGSLHPRLSLAPMIVKCPTLSVPVESLSFYMFVYDTLVPLSLQQDTSLNLSLNTGMSTVARATPIGERNIYAPTTIDNPDMGPRIIKTELSPDAQIYTSSDQAMSLDKTIQKLRTSIGRSLRSSRSQNKPNFFSPLWLSRDSSENNKFLFAFDLLAYLEAHSIFPYLYQNSHFATMLTQKGASPLAPPRLSSVQELRVLRRYCEPGALVSNNSLGTIAPILPRKTDRTFPQTEIDNVVPVSGTQQNSTALYFEGEDTFSSPGFTNEQIVGDFQYGVNLSVYDASLELVRNIASLLQSLEYELSAIYQFLMNKDKNTKLSKLPLSGLNIFLGAENIGVDTKLEEILTSYGNLITQLSATDLGSEIFTHYIKQIRVSNKKSIFSTVKEVHTLISTTFGLIYETLSSVAPDNPLGERFTSLKNKPLAPNSGNMSNFAISRIEHFFEDVFKRGRDYGYGIEYMNPSSTPRPGSFPSYSSDEFAQRRGEEFRKYFQGPRASTLVVPMGSYLDSSYSYMTAKTIKTPDREIINQPSYAKDGSPAVSYDINRYGQLFVDILNLRTQSDNNYPYPSLVPKASLQLEGNKTYQSAVDLLAEKYGVSFPDEEVVEFSAPKIITGITPTTVVTDPNNTCKEEWGFPLLPSVIGGSKSINPTVESYLIDSNVGIKLKDIIFQAGYSIQADNIKIQTPRPNKLPFAILGELAIDDEMDLRITYQQKAFNSLTKLKEFLDISPGELLQSIQGTYITNMPNQTKSMLGIAASNQPNVLGDIDRGFTFDVCRPKLHDKYPSKNTDELVSYYGDQEKIPPYPQTRDPMKTYAKFLAFWMNYKQIGVIEYLEGFVQTNSNINAEISGTPVTAPVSTTKLKQPLWRKLSSEVEETLTNNQKIFCRVRPISAEDYINIIRDEVPSDQMHKLVEIFETKEMFKLPTYNTYFYLHGGATLTSQDALPATLGDGSPPVEPQTNLGGLVGGGGY